MKENWILSKLGRFGVSVYSVTLAASVSVCMHAGLGQQSTGRVSTKKDVNRIDTGMGHTRLLVPAQVSSGASVSGETLVGLKLVVVVCHVDEVLGVQHPGLNLISTPRLAQHFSPQPPPKPYSEQWWAAWLTSACRSPLHRVRRRQYAMDIAIRLTITDG